MTSSTDIKLIVYAAMMAALTAVGAFIAIPIGPVPIVLQNFFVFLTGLLLGSRWGAAAIFVYLLAGALGLPVFAGGKGGIGHIFGPTGGYLLGYLPAVFIIGLISEKGRHRPVIDTFGLLCGVFVVYACGVPWLKMVTGMPFQKAVAVGMLPFLLGDGLKVLAALPVAKALRPLVDGRLGRYAHEPH
jgi:biotin transport system substrate-specific component